MNRTEPFVDFSIMFTNNHYLNQWCYIKGAQDGNKHVYKCRRLLEGEKIPEILPRRHSAIGIWEGVSLHESV